MTVTMCFLSPLNDVYFKGNFVTTKYIGCILHKINKIEKSEDNFTQGSFKEYLQSINEMNKCYYLFFSNLSSFLE